jgi:hypothetical protein
MNQLWVEISGISQIINSVKNYNNNNGVCEIDYLVFSLIQWW